MARTGQDFAFEFGPVGEERTLAPGEQLVEIGAEADEVFVVRSGRFEVLGGHPDDNNIIATIGPGELVGEVSLVSGGTRTATVRAIEKSVVGVVTRERFERMLSERPTLAAKVAIEARRRLERSAVARLAADLLSEPDPGLVQDLNQHVEWVRLNSGETLFSEGDEADAAYFVATGRLLATQTDPDGAQKRLRELGRGEVVGELGLIDGSPRGANIVAIRDSTLARLSAEAFEKILAEHPMVMRQMLRVVKERLQRPGIAAGGTGTLTVVIAGPIDTNTFMTDLVAEIGRHGPTFHLNRDRAAGMWLGARAVEEDDESPVDLRLAEFFDELEVSNRHVVYEGDKNEMAWTSRALGRADRILIVCSAVPTEDEERVIRSVLANVAHDRNVERWLGVLHSTERPAGAGELRRRYDADRVANLRSGEQEDVRRLARLVTGNATTLVLGGGGARGLAHLGVYRALDELGVKVDAVAGSSIGAITGAVIATGLPPDQAIADISTADMNTLDYTLPVVSLLAGERVRKGLHDFFGDVEIEDLLLPYFCTATNLTTAAVEYLCEGPLLRALRATSSLPGVMPPVPSGEHLLVDGGVLDNLPVTEMRRRGYAGTIIAVDVAPPRGPRAHADYGLSVSGLKALTARWGKGRSPYPRIASVLMRSMIVGSMQQRDRVVAAGEADVYLDLDLRGVPLLDFDVLESAVEKGYETSHARIEEWLAQRAPGPG